MVGNREALEAVARAHAAAEGSGDMAGTMATLEPDPLYTLLPAGRQLRGTDTVRRYYDYFFAAVAPRIAGYDLIGEWVNDIGLAQEYTIAVRNDDGTIGTHHVFGILTFGATRLSGERLYASDAFFRILFGPLWDEAEPLKP